MMHEFIFRDSVAAVDCKPHYLNTFINVLLCSGSARRLHLFSEVNTVIFLSPGLILNDVDLIVSVGVSVRCKANNANI